MKDGYMQGTLPWQRKVYGSTLADLIGDMPNLDGALCVGRWEVFDASTSDINARAEAVILCSQCPAQEPCFDWLASLPDNAKPVAVTAGVYPTRHAHKPKPVPPPATVQPEDKPSTGQRPAQNPRRASKPPTVTTARRQARLASSEARNRRQSVAS